MTKEPAKEIRGKSFRFKWSIGPTKGETHELVFGDDGNVSWGKPGGRKDKEPKEQAKYAALTIAVDIYLVSFMSSSGYTLTVVLNFKDQGIVGFASGAKDWFPVEGNFEVVD